MHPDRRVSQLIHYAREIVIAPRSQDDLVEDVPLEGDTTEILRARVHRKDGGTAFPLEERSEGARARIRWPELQPGDVVEVAVREWTDHPVGGRGDPPFYFMDYAGATVEPLSAADVFMAIAERRAIARAWSAFLLEYPLILSPIWTQPPFPHGFDIESQAGGEATIWVGELCSAAQERELAAAMTEAVAAEYRALIEEASATRDQAPGRRRRTLGRLRRELRRIRARDYFPPPEEKGGWRTLLPESGVPDAAQKAKIREVGGVDWDKLAQAWEFCSSVEGANQLLVIRRGQIVGEWSKDCDRKKAFNIYSSSKSYTSVAWGLLLKDSEEGKLPGGKKITLETKVCNEQWLPESLPLSDPRKADITVRHLLNMASGLGTENPPAEAPFEWSLGKVETSPVAKLKGDPGTVPSRHDAIVGDGPYLGLTPVTMVS